SAPLSRMSFDRGDTLTTADGLRLVVDEVSDHNGLLIYMAHPINEPGNVQPVPESHLGHRLRLKGALERLLTNQLSSNRWFELRVQALQALANSQQSPVR